MMSSNQHKSTIVKVIETPVCEVMLDSRSIAITRYKPEALVTLEEIKVVELALEEITGGKRFKNILDSRGIYTAFDAEARRYAASSPITKNIIASAFVVNTLPSRILANFFLKFNKPRFKVKVFSDYNSAYNWLLKLKD